MADQAERPDPESTEPVSNGVSLMVAEAPEPTVIQEPLAIPVHPADRPELFINWRTLDPAEIRGDDARLEELRAYREMIEELLANGEGKYVLISGGEVVSYFPDLRTAAEYVSKHMNGKSILVKRVVAIEPRHFVERAVN